MAGQKVKQHPMTPFAMDRFGHALPWEYAGSKFPGAFDTRRVQGPTSMLSKRRAIDARPTSAGKYLGASTYTLGTEEAPQTIRLSGQPGGVNDAFVTMQDILAEGTISPDMLYEALGADPSDVPTFMSRVRLQWQEAMVAAMGDPETAKGIFQGNIVRSAFPTSEVDMSEWDLDPMGFLGGFQGFGTTSAAGAGAEAEEQEFELPVLDKELWGGFEPG
jgi:hypothetical protein